MLEIGQHNLVNACFVTGQGHDLIKFPDCASTIIKTKYIPVYICVSMHAYCPYIVEFLSGLAHAYIIKLFVSGISNILLLLERLILN